MSVQVEDGGQMDEKVGRESAAVPTPERRSGAKLATNTTRKRKVRQRSKILLRELGKLKDEILLRTETKNEIDRKVTSLEESRKQHANTIGGLAGKTAETIAESSQRIANDSEQISTRTTEFSSTSTNVNSKITALEQKQRGEYVSPVKTSNRGQGPSRTDEDSRTVSERQLNTSKTGSGIIGTALSFLGRLLFSVRDAYLKNPNVSAVITILVIVLWMRLRQRQRRQ